MLAGVFLCVLGDCWKVIKYSLHSGVELSIKGRIGAESGKNGQEGVIIRQEGCRRWGSFGNGVCQILVSGK